MWLLKNKQAVDLWLALELIHKYVLLYTNKQTRLTVYRKWPTSWELGSSRHLFVRVATGI
jgi:hypothetical protein